MATHKDNVFQDGDLSEWQYFNIRNHPYPVMEFIPWPLKVAGLIFQDGSEMFTAGGGGGAGVSFLAGPGISLTPGLGTLTIGNTQTPAQMQSPWVGPVNANGWGITNLASINGLPIGNYLQTPWLQNINAAQFVLGNIPEIDFVFGSFTGSIFMNNVGFQINSNTRAIYINSSAGVELSGPDVFVLAGITSGPAFQVETSSNGMALLVLANSNVGLSQVPAYKLDVNGDINISAGSVYRINGVPISFAGGAFVGDNPPTTPANGDFWWDATGLKLYIRFSGAWVGI